MRECFRDAIVAGWLDENPVREVRAARVVVQRSRLTLEVWQKVYDAAEQPWLRNAMLLALLSAQRREDLVLATVTDVRDGLWFVDQGKTGAKIALSLSLRLNCLGMSLGDAYKQCRGTGVLSRFLIHQTEPRGNSPIGSAIWKDTLSRRFTDTLIGLKLDFEGKNPPTFHEIRSLSERLYAAQGDVNTQDLLGHKDPRSTAVYHELRGVEWLKVEAR
jgi:integrase